MLLEHFEAVVRRQGFTRIRLAMVAEKSLGFWQHMGFKGSYGAGNGFWKDLMKGGTGTS